MADQFHAVAAMCLALAVWCCLGVWQVPQPTPRKRKLTSSAKSSPTPTRKPKLSTKAKHTDDFEVRRKCSRRKTSPARVEGLKLGAARENCSLMRTKRSGWPSRRRSRRRPPAASSPSRSRC